MAARWGHPEPVQSQRRQRILAWLDDFDFFVSGSQEEAEAMRNFSFNALAALGIMRNATKGQPEPSTLLWDHLGFAIDSEQGLFLLTEEHERKLRLGAIHLLRTAAQDGRWAPARSIASFAGLAQSTHLALPLTRC